MAAAKKKNYQLSVEKVHRRLNLETGRQDIMSPVIKGNDEKGMSISEIGNTFNILIVAGSETTGTVLSGVTNNLTRNPTCLAKLVNEVRFTFKEEKDITFAALRELSYLNAVIQEGLRICPPTAGGLPRLVPEGGDTVCGLWFPAGVCHPFISVDSNLRGLSTLNTMNFE